jgi:hypothetical protein
MSALLRRLIVLMLLGATVATSYRLVRRRTDEAPSTDWPPFAADDPPVGSVGPPDAVVTGSASGSVEPDGGQCPLDHPIKANSRSGIYHIPGGRFYDRTAPDRCYASEAAAEADGYRRSRS